MCRRIRPRVDDGLFLRQRDADNHDNGSIDADSDRGRPLQARPRGIAAHVAERHAAGGAAGDRVGAAGNPCRTSIGAAIGDGSGDVGGGGGAGAGDLPGTTHAGDDGGGDSAGSGTRPEGTGIDRYSSCGNRGRGRGGGGADRRRRAARVVGGGGVGVTGWRCRGETWEHWRCWGSPWRCWR